MSSEETTGDASGSSLLLNQPVVIDNGTATLKAGFAGTSKPKASCYLTTIIMRVIDGQLYSMQSNLGAISLFVPLVEFSEKGCVIFCLISCSF